MEAQADDVRNGMRAWRPELEPYLRKSSVYEMGEVKRRKVAIADAVDEAEESWE